MKILITGSTGQLGSELKDVFASKDELECFFLNKNQLPLHQIDIIQDILSVYEPDIVIHAGAYTAVDLAESEKELANAVNHLASEEIAIYCHRFGVKLIAISTDYVFDGNSSIPLHEDEPVAPINVYGLSKLNGEKAILKFCPEATIIRTSWVYSTYGKNFVKTMIRLMCEKEQIYVINDQIGSPTYAKDLAEVILTIITSKKWYPGVYHYSNDGEISWFDFAVAIREIQGLTCDIIPVPTEEFPTAAKRPKYSLLDKAKIKQTYNLNIPSWKDSLKEMLDKL